MTSSSYLSNWKKIIKQEKTITNIPVIILYRLPPKFRNVHLLLNPFFISRIPPPIKMTKKATNIHGYIFLLSHVSTHSLQMCTIHMDSLDTIGGNTLLRVSHRSAGVSLPPQCSIKEHQATNISSYHYEANPLEFNGYYIYYTIFWKFLQFVIYL